MSDIADHSEKILRCIADGVITTDVKGVITYMNPIAEKLTGVCVKDAVGERFTELVQLKRDDDGKTVLQGERDELTSDHVAIMYAKDGQQYSVSYSITAFQDGDGKAVGYVIVLHDLTSEYDLGRKLKWQVLHDNLTRAKNRKAFELRVQNILSGRYKEEDYSLVYLDIDYFKVVNDIGGTEAGDQLLKQVSHILHEQLREGDLLCRVGGDEFAVILKDCQMNRAEEIGNRLRLSISENPFSIGGRTFHVTMSAGLVPIGEALSTTRDVIAYADRCCKIAKDSGGDCLHVYKEDDGILALRKDELDALHDLHHALEFESFSLSWQIIKPASDSAEYDCLYEFLVRLTVEDGETILPENFIPIAERYGLMAKLDRWVIKQAFHIISSRPASDRVLYNINLSGQTLGDKDSLYFIKEQIERCRIEPKKICFEITEAAVVDSFNTAKKLIEELRGMGCRFALDDFGTGLSSFACLKHFKVDLIKIDGEFIRHICNDRVDQAMVHTVQTAAEDLGITTIAEWVENQETLDILKGMGIEYFQGNYIGEPEEIKLQFSI